LQNDATLALKIFEKIKIRKKYTERDDNQQKQDIIKSIHFILVIDGVYIRWATKQQKVNQDPQAPYQLHAQQR